MKYIIIAILAVFGLCTLVIISFVLAAGDYDPSWDEQMEVENNDDTGRA